MSFTKQQLEEIEISHPETPFGRLAREVLRLREILEPRELRKGDQYVILDGPFHRVVTRREIQSVPDNPKYRVVRVEIADEPSGEHGCPDPEGMYGCPEQAKAAAEEVLAAQGKMSMSMLESILARLTCLEDGHDWAPVTFDTIRAKRTCGRCGRKYNYEAGIGWRKA